MSVSGETHIVLDHGYVQFVEHWGSDERVIQAARMSTGKGFLGWEPGDCPRCIKGIDDFGNECHFCAGKGTHAGDKRLLKFLYDHNHRTPFEMAGMTIEVQAPIFVFREWHRHRTQSYNEMSARYTPLPNVNYLPGEERCFMVSGTNKQASTVKGAKELTHEAALDGLERLAKHYAASEDLYQYLLALGFPKELARLPVPVGRYSRMMASANLRNWLAFLTLRMDPAAQWEIRQFAHAVGTLIKDNYPRTWKLYVEGRETA